MFELKTTKPNIILQKWIKSYWLVKYKRNNLIMSQNKTIIPYDNICLLFVIESENNKYSNQTMKSGIYICPPSLDRHTLNLNSDLYYIDVSLYPGVFFKLFGIPVSKLEDRVYEISELSLKFDLSIIEILDELKGNMVATINKLDNYLLKIFEDMEEDNLLLNIFELSKNHNLDNFYNQNRLSQRQIQRKVKEFTGMAPKSIERINRFYSTLKQIKSNKNSIDFKELATENNFYDQSSFIKEFKFFTGLTPSIFLSNSEDFLQYKCDIFC